MGDLNQDALAPAGDQEIAPPGFPEAAVWLTPWARMAGAASFLLVLAALFSLAERYAGIRKDALLYVLQGLAHINPVPLSGDVFLKFGSQDQFSVISSISGLAIEQVGIDHGAAILTFLFLAFWYTSAWLLARWISGRELAFLSLSLLFLLPGWYGAKQIFRYAEPMMTARTLAEALSLAALLALVMSRKKTAVVLLLFGISVHPLMAFPVVLLAALYLTPIDGTRSWMVVTIILVLGAIIGALVAGLPAPLVNDEWLTVIRHRSSFLFTESWSPHDWEVTAQVVATLALGIMAAKASPGRRLLQCALAVTVVGLALTVISSEWLPIRLLLQGQPWRWEWIGRALSVALLPWILVHVWRSDTGLGRTVVVTMMSGWMLGSTGTFQHFPPFGTGGLLCVSALCLWGLRGRLSNLDGRYWDALTLVIFGATTLSAVMTMAAILGNRESFSAEPVWVQRLLDSANVPVVSVSIALAAWWLLIVRARVFAAIACSLTALVMLLGSGPGFLEKLARTPFGDEQRGRFIEWRSTIPVEAEVLWSEAPHMTWFLLDRRSYMSISQGAGLVFSERTAGELVKRAAALEALAPPGKWFLDPTTNTTEFNELTTERLESICKAPGLSFVISRDEVAGAIHRAEWPGKADYIFLYDCSRVEHGV